MTAWRKRPNGHMERPTTCRPYSPKRWRHRHSRSRGVRPGQTNGGSRSLEDKQRGGELVALETLTVDERRAKSALILMVPGVTELVGDYRRKYTEDGATVPPHFTLMFPF